MREGTGIVRRVDDRREVGVGVMCEIGRVMEVRDDGVGSRRVVVIDEGRVCSVDVLVGLVIEDAREEERGTVGVGECVDGGDDRVEKGDWKEEVCRVGVGNQGDREGVLVEEDRDDEDRDEGSDGTRVEFQGGNDVGNGLSVTVSR